MEKERDTQHESMGKDCKSERDRPTERNKRKLTQRMKSEKNEAKRSLKRQTGKKNHFNNPRKSRIPLHPHETTRSVWPLPEPQWHFTETERANEPLRHHCHHH